MQVMAIRLLCAGSRLYGLRELVCGDDTEQLVAQAWVIRDGLSQLLGPSGIVHGPDDLWVVATGGGLFEAGGEVVLVVVGLGEQAGGVLGAEVDLEEPVVLVALCCGGDGFEVWFEPAPYAGYQRPGSPAGWFGADQGRVSAVGSGGFVDDDACLGDGQGVAQKRW